MKTFSNQMLRSPKQGDIVLVPFPFSNLKDSKLRPALIVSGSSYNLSKDVLLSAITTTSGLPFSIHISGNDLSRGKLLKSSYICVSKLMSLEKSLLVEKVGRIKSDVLSEVIELIFECFE